MCPVFDTAVADLILVGGKQMRGLGTLVDIHVRPGLMTEKDKVKHRQGTWTQRPLPRELLEYAWQDVAWCAQVWHNMRDRAISLDILDVIYESTRNLIRDKKGPLAVEGAVVVVSDLTDVLVVRETGSLPWCDTSPLSNFVTPPAGKIFSAYIQELKTCLASMCTTDDATKKSLKFKFMKAKLRERLVLHGKPVVFLHADFHTDAWLRVSEQMDCLLQQVPIAAIRGIGGVEEPINKWLRHTKIFKEAHERRAQALHEAVHAIHWCSPKRGIEELEGGGAESTILILPPRPQARTFTDMVTSEEASKAMRGDQLHCICEQNIRDRCPCCDGLLATHDTEWSPKGEDFFRSGPFKGQKVRRSGFVCPAGYYISANGDESLLSHEARDVILLAAHAARPRMVEEPYTLHLAMISFADFVLSQWRGSSSALTHLEALRLDPFLEVNVFARRAEVDDMTGKEVDPEDPGAGMKHSKHTIEHLHKKGHGAEESHPSHGPGQEAVYRPTMFQPFTEDPKRFIHRLHPESKLPSGEMIKEAQGTDPECLKLIKQAEVSASTRPAVSATPSTSNQSRRKRKKERRDKEATWRNGEPTLGEDGILRCWVEDGHGHMAQAVVVPQVYRKVLFEAAHDSLLHHDRRRTLSALRSMGAWWPNMESTVGKLIQQCTSCCFIKRQKYQGGMQTPSNGFEPWHTVAVDVVDLEETQSGYRKAVVFICRYTREVMAFPATEKLNSEDFLNILTFGLLPYGRCPRVLYSDRGSNLISALCQAYYEAMAIKNIAADSHSHTLVGICERFNSTLRDVAKAAWFDNRCQWDLYLPFAVAYYNAETHPGTGYSPFYLNHGREFPYPWRHGEWPGLLAKPPYSDKEYVSRQLTALHASWEAAQAKLRAVEDGRRNVHDNKYRTNVKLQVGDRVLVERPGPFNKMELPWRGPYRVAETLPLDRYRLTSASGFRMHPIFHISKLKKFPNVQLGDEVDDEEFFEIEDVVDVRTGVDGQPLYRIRWKGYGPQFDEWHTVDDLGDEAIIFAQNREAEMRAKASATPAPPPATPKNVAKKAKAKKAKACSSTAEAAPTNEKEESSQESELRQKRAEQRAAAKEARQVSVVEPVSTDVWDPSCVVRAAKVCFFTDGGFHYAWRRRSWRNPDRLRNFDYPGGTADASESPGETLLREVEEEISLPTPEGRGQGLEDALRAMVQAHPHGMARQIVIHPTTLEPHDVRVWAIRGSRRDLLNIRQRVEGTREGGMPGLHHEDDVLAGPHAILYADAARAAILTLPEAPALRESQDVASSSRGPTGQYRYQRPTHGGGGPSPAANGTRRVRTIVHREGFLRALRGSK